jgi:hypothetical protein
MRKRKAVMIPLMIVGVALFIFVGGQVVMHLWNWLLPGLFGWKMLTFWQALGLLVLCRILFGGLGHGPAGRARGRMGERWKNMTPEERERVRSRFRGAWGGEPPADVPSAT